MKNTATAYFVRLPRRLSDLRVPHLLKSERPYEIVKTILLSQIDYENFSEDLLADRQFIEDNYDVSSDDDIFKCLLIKRRKHNDGILIVPEMGAYVKWAAYITDVEL